jgi:hypothetical protein
MTSPIIKLGELPQRRNTWVGGIDADDHEVFVSFHTTREFDDEDYFVEGGLMRLSFDAPAQRLASSKRPPGRVSVDARQAYWSHSGVFAVPRGGGEPKQLREGAALIGRAGGELILSGSRGIVALDVSTGRERPIATVFGIKSSAVSQRHLYLAQRQSTLLRIDLQTGEQRRVGKLGQNYFTVVAHGPHVAASVEATSSNKCIVSIVGERAVSLRCERDQLRVLAVDERHAYYRRGHWAIWRAPLDGSAAELFATDTAIIASATFAGDYLVWTADHVVSARRRRPTTEGPSVVTPAPTSSLSPDAGPAELHCRLVVMGTGPYRLAIEATNRGGTAAVLRYHYPLRLVLEAEVNGRRVELRSRASSMQVVPREVEVPAGGSATVGTPTRIVFASPSDPVDDSPHVRQLLHAPAPVTLRALRAFEDQTIVCAGKLTP